MFLNTFFKKFMPPRKHARNNDFGFYSDTQSPRLNIIISSHKSHTAMKYFWSIKWIKTHVRASAFSKNLISGEESPYPMNGANIFISLLQFRTAWFSRSFGSMERQKDRFWWLLYHKPTAKISKECHKKGNPWVPEALLGLILKLNYATFKCQQYNHDH